jgi:hypothetical protein
MFATRATSLPANSRPEKQGETSGVSRRRMPSCRPSPSLILPSTTSPRADPSITAVVANTCQRAPLRSRGTTRSRAAMTPAPPAWADRFPPQARRARTHTRHRCRRLSVVARPSPKRALSASETPRRAASTAGSMAARPRRSYVITTMRKLACGILTGLMMLALASPLYQGCGGDSATSSGGSSATCTSCGSGDVYWDSGAKRCRDNDNGQFVKSCCCGH